MIYVNVDCVQTRAHRLTPPLIAQFTIPAVESMFLAALQPVW